MSKTSFKDAIKKCLPFNVKKVSESIFINLLRYALPVWFDILGHYGESHKNGKPVWEVLTCESSRIMAQETVKTYRENEPGTVSIGIL